jgi:hypothetical protein
MRDFVLCLNNEANPASLIVGKVYPVVPDAAAARLGLLRVLDEDKSEPDGYLYPANLFIPVSLPKVAEQVLLAH